MFQLTADHFLLPGGIPEEPGAKLDGADRRIDCRIGDMKPGVGFRVYIVQNPADGLKLQPGKQYGGFLPEPGRNPVLVELEQFCVNIHLQAHVAAVIAVAFFLKTGFPVNVGMAAGIQGIMSQESGDICFCNFPLLPVREKPAAFYEIAQEGSGGFDMGNGADIIVVYQIRGKEIKEYIRSLKSETEGCMVFQKGFLELFVV